MERKREAIAKQEEELESVQTELMKETSSVESTVNNAKNEEFLLKKKQIVAKIKKITEKVQFLSLSPAEKPDMEVQVVDTGMLRSVCKKFSFTYKLADPSKCTVEGDSLSVTETDKITKFTLHLIDCEGSPCIGQQKVTEELNNRVSVFHTSGQFITTFGDEYLDHPEGLTIDEDGFVYVTSHHSNIFVF